MRELFESLGADVPILDRLTLLYSVGGSFRIEDFFYLIYVLMS